MDIQELDQLVPVWLTYPDAAERLGLDVAGVRRLIDDAELVSVKRGTPAIRSIPESLVSPEVVQGLAGTVTLLRDSGFSDPELLGWLLTPQDDGPSPLELLRSGTRKEVRRRAQLLAF